MFVPSDKFFLLMLLSLLIIDKVILFCRYVDFVNLMAYDFHSYVWYLPETGHNAPLFPNQFDKGLFSTLNTNWSANYWHELGMPRRKIQIGIPTYAHTFRYTNNQINNYQIKKKLN